MPIPSAAHWVFFPLVSSKRCCLPQIIYICRQRMSLHSPWSPYVFQWKRNLSFEAMDLWDNQAESSFRLWTGWGHALLRDHFLVQQDFQMRIPLNSRCRNMEWTWCWARKGCERTPWAIHLLKNRSPNLGAASSSHLREIKEVLGVWSAPCHHIPLCDQDRNLFLSCVICWNCSAAPGFVSPLQFLFWQTATRQELHPQVKWIFP